VSEARDQIDPTRAEVHALIYLTASVNDGIVRVHPDIHGLYETWQAAEAVRRAMTHPTDYRVCKGMWRKP
jgi:hypothetical protein